jgi:hypothetical protein
MWVPGPQLITYREIQAYDELAEVHLTLLEIEIIKMLDLAVIPVMGKTLKQRLKKKIGPGGDQDDDAAKIDPKDTRGVLGLFKGIAARANARYKK